jgi:hypothetical protein
MRTITVSFQVSEEQFLTALEKVAKDNKLKVKKDLDLNKIGPEFAQDVQEYIMVDLPQFLEEGYYNDVYQDCFED